MVSVVANEAGEIKTATGHDQRTPSLIDAVIKTLVLLHSRTKALVGLSNLLVGWFSFHTYLVNWVP